VAGEIVRIDNVAGIFKETTIASRALGECLLSPFPLGDVSGYALDAGRDAVVIDKPCAELQGHVVTITRDHFQLVDRGAVERQ
jgi:hypothetical protein